MKRKSRWIYLIVGFYAAALTIVGIIGATAIWSRVARSETMSVSPPAITQAPTSTIGNLPSCSTSLRGRIFVVTDALVPVALATVAAGGAVTVGVICNGTNWIVL